MGRRAMKNTSVKVHQYANTKKKEEVDIVVFGRGSRGFKGKGLNAASKNT